MCILHQKTVHLLAAPVPINLCLCPASLSAKIVTRTLLSRRAVAIPIISATHFNSNASLFVMKLESSKCKRSCNIPEYSGNPSSLREPSLIWGFRAAGGACKSCKKNQIWSIRIKRKWVNYVWSRKTYSCYNVCFCELKLTTKANRKNLMSIL